MMCRRLLLACAGWVVPVAIPGWVAEAVAAVPTPAHWAVDLPKGRVASGAAFVVKVSAQIEPGWHIYAMEEPDGGPIPTQIGVAEGDPLTLLSVDEPKPRMVMDPVLRRPTGMFQNSISFTLHLRSSGRLPAGAMGHVLVRYQACNDQVCLPPHTETVAFPLDGLLK